MGLIEAFKKHIYEVSWFQLSGDFPKEIDKFISENGDLSEADLLEKIYLVYGTRIKFFEEATRCKYLKSIKGWVAIFGFFFILGIVIWTILLFL